jgi:hypothetical protein
LKSVARLTGQLRDGQASQQRPDVEADHRLVAGAGGDLHVHEVEVAVMAGRPWHGPQVALLVALLDEARARAFLASTNARGPAGIVSVR